MFKEYQSKPITRKAAKIGNEELVYFPEKSEAMYEGTVFKCYEEPKVGDYICFLNDNDIYHCNAKIFAERNELEEPVNTVTQERVDSRIVEKEVKTVELVGKKHTLVAVKLANGFSIIETTTCVSAVNYSEEIGAEICMEKITNKIWMLEGYLLQEKLSK